MERNEQLKEGNVIQIKGKPGVHIVVAFRNRKDTDHLRGDNYFVDEFETIRMSTRAFADNVDHFTHFEEEVAQTHCFYFTDGSMSGHGVGISRADVKIIGALKIKANVTTTYAMSGYKEAKQ